MPDFEEIKLGGEAYMYVDPQGIDAETPAWDELDLIQDADLNLEKDEVDVSVRRSKLFKLAMGGKIGASFEFQIPWLPTDTAFAALFAVWNRTAAKKYIGVAILDDSIENGGEGLLADMDVLQFNRAEHQTEGMVANIVLKPTYSPNNPRWATAGGSEW